MKQSQKIKVENTEVAITSIDERDYISLTDIAKYKTSDPAGDLNPSNSRGLDGKQG
jgi:hypothetical protein